MSERCSTRLYVMVSREVRRDWSNITMRTRANLKISPQLIRWVVTSLLKMKVALRLGAWAYDQPMATTGVIIISGHFKCVYLQGVF